MKNITDETVNKFRLYLYEEEKSENTIEKYMRDIRFFRKWLGTRRADKTAVLEYKKELCGRYAPKSVNSVLSSLNALFVYMDRYDLKIKTLKIQRRIFADKEKELTKAEYERLLTAAKDKQTLALLDALVDWQKEDKLFENQQLFKTPIVRNGKKATVGYQPEIWKTWE